MKIKTFNDFSEIESLNGFLPDLPISNLTYDEIIGDYHLNPKLDCCYQRDTGNLCRKKHHYGFVVRLKSGDLTVIGNCCAVKKFDADSKIRVDRLKYRNEAERQKILSNIFGLIDKKEDIICSLNKAKHQLDDIKLSLRRLRDELGSFLSFQLSKMAKTHNSDVEVRLVFEKEIKKENKTVEVEVTYTIQKIGSILGVNIFNYDWYESIEKNLLKTLSFYTETLNVDINSSKRELVKLSTNLNKYRDVLSGVDDVTNQFNLFKSSDLSCLCYLNSNKLERFKAAKVILSLKGLPNGKEKGKALVTQLDSQIKFQTKAKRIEILNR